MPEYPTNGDVYYSKEVSAEMLESYNCAVVITDHDDFDPEFRGQTFTSNPGHPQHDAQYYEGERKGHFIG